MAERKTGPIKPPVIEGTARQTAAAKPEPVTESAPVASPEDKPQEPKPSTPIEKSQPEPVAAKQEKPEVELQEPASVFEKTVIKEPASFHLSPKTSILPAASAGALGGAVLGLALAYGLASIGLWPAITDHSSDSRVQGLEQRLSATTGTAQTAINDAGAASARIDATQQEISSLSSAVTDLKSAGAPDLTGIETSIKTLSDRIDAIGAGASSADAGALAENLARLEAGLTEVTGKLGALDAKSASADTSMKTLGSDLENIKTALAAEAEKPSPQSIMEPALRLPLVLSGLEAAFASGRPFASELASLKSILPQTEVPSAIEDTAQLGLADPRAMIARFDSALPDILAARPAKPDASWNDSALDWFKNLLVLRPSGDVGGDSPDAVLARLEKSISDSDFIAATPLFEDLPETMRLAAGKLPQDIAALGAAGTFIAGLRTNALAQSEVKP